MFSAIARQTRLATASTARLVSNWYSRGDYLPCTLSGEPGTMRPRSKTAITAALFAFSSGLLFAQTKDADQDAIFSSETRLVPLNVTVADKAGHLVTNLQQSAFQVFENGQPQQIKLFKREDVPVSLALIIDNSGSMREKRSAVESAALALVKDSNPMDEAIVVNFNEQAFLDTCQGGAPNCFTSDIKVMEQALTKI